MYKFKSRAAGDLIMLDPNGQQILTIIGKFDGPADRKGILLPEQMPAAIEALESSSRSLQDIGFDMGYSTASAFIAMFQRLACCTPEQYRRKARHV